MQCDISIVPIVLCGQYISYCRRERTIRSRNDSLSHTNSFSNSSKRKKIYNKRARVNFIIQSRFTSLRLYSEIINLTIRPSETDFLKKKEKANETVIVILKNIIKTLEILKDQS